MNINHNIRNKICILIKQKISSILLYFAGYISIEKPFKENPNIKMGWVDIGIKRFGNKRRSKKYKKFDRTIDWKNYL